MAAAEDNTVEAGRIRPTLITKGRIRPAKAIKRKRVAEREVAEAKLARSQAGRATPRNATLNPYTGPRQSQSPDAPKAAPEVLARRAARKAARSAATLVIKAREEAKPKRVRKAAPVDVPPPVANIGDMKATEALSVIEQAGSESELHQLLEQENAREQGGRKTVLSAIETALEAYALPTGEGEQDGGEEAGDGE